ncbi:MAG: hypothetical protein ACYCOO_00555 [Chitinophagaceae bacterium]
MAAIQQSFLLAHCALQGSKEPYIILRNSDLTQELDHQNLELTDKKWMKYLQKKIGRTLEHQSAQGNRIYLRSFSDAD